MTVEPIDRNKPATDSERLDFKRVLPIFVIVFVDLLGLTIIIPLLNPYAIRYGASPFMIGLLAATYPLLQFIGAPILGRLSDRYGRRPILIISQFGTLVGFLMLGFADTLWLIFLSRAIDGISGANIATAQAAISDVTTPKTRTQGLGLIGAAFGLGFIIGPALAGTALLLTDNNYSAPAFMAAIFSFLSIILTVVLFKETLPAERRGQGAGRPSRGFGAMGKALRHPAVGLLLLLIFVKQVAFGGFEQLLALFTFGRLGLNAVGNTLVFVFVGLIVVTVQAVLVGRWSRRYGDRRVIYAGFALLATGFLAMAFTPRQPPPWYSEAAIREEMANPSARIEGPAIVSENAVPPPDDNTGWLGLLWLLAAMVPVAIGGGVLQPSINSLITKRVSPMEIGGMLGISAAFLSLANVVAPLLGGAVFQLAGATVLFLLWSVMMGTLFVLARRRLRPAPEEAAAS